MNRKALIPLGIFAVLVVFLAIGLTRDPHEIPSPLIGKPAPAFTAPQLQNPQQQFSGKDMLGKVWLLVRGVSARAPDPDGICQDQDHPRGGN
jgi:cytochrome c biogenesis protein CcmG/thiol:disulfide interchange protein DsbE